LLFLLFTQLVFALFADELSEKLSDVQTKIKKRHNCE